MKKIALLLYILILSIINLETVHANISINCNNLYLGVGTNIAVKATGNTTSITWSSTNSQVVSVSNGIVTGKSLGEAYINAVNANQEGDVCKITVIDNYIPVSDITLSETNTILNINETKKINTTISPSNASNKTISYISQDSSIATIDLQGNITGKKVGTTYISITIENLTELYKVTVIDNISLKGISIESTKELEENGTGKLNVTYNPSNATNKKITWKSSNSNIVTVDTNGNLKAISPGSATITAISNDGNHVATSKITVNAIDKTLKNISLNKKEITLYTGKEETLTVSFNPSNAANKKVSWSSSNENVAKVIDGKIIAIKPGTAEIKVISDEGNHEAICQLTVLSLPIESIKFKEESLEVYVGSTTTLETVSTPEYSVINEPIWTSSNEEIATVSDGIVTALAIGETIVTISDKDNKIAASIPIKVVEKPEDPLMITIEGYNLNFNPQIKNYTLHIGNETSLKITTNREDNEITIGGNRDLKNGSIITIATKDKNKDTYVINIKKSGNYTIYFIAIISLLLLINIIRILIKNKKNK